MAKTEKKKQAPKKPKIETIKLGITPGKTVVYEETKYYITAKGTYRNKQGKEVKFTF